MKNNTILADATEVFDNPLVQSFIQPIFYLIGGAILLLTVWRAVTGFAKGDFAKVARTIFGGFIAVLLCFNLELSVTLVNSATNLMQTVVDTVSDTLGGSDGDSTGGTVLPGGSNVPPPPAP